MVLWPADVQAALPSRKITTRDGAQAEQASTSTVQNDRNNLASTACAFIVSYHWHASDGERIVLAGHRLRKSLSAYAVA